MPVDTKKVPGRRNLHITSLKDAIADAQRLVASDHAGTLDRLGNWSLGRTLGHMAFWMNLPFDGYPPELRPPWIVKLIARMMRNKFINGPMPAGFRIGKFKEGTMGTDELSTQEGFDRFRRACERLDSTSPTCDNPVFGTMSHDEWKHLNLAHVNLHLSFFVPR